MSDNGSEEEMSPNEERIEFSCPDHSANLLLKMNELRLSHSDTQLVVDSKIFNVHKLVLMVESTYFEELFKDDSNEVIKIDEIRSDIMEILGRVFPFIYFFPVSMIPHWPISNVSIKIVYSCDWIIGCNMNAWEKVMTNRNSGF